MRPIPPALQVKLSSGATTLCRCWTIARRDGAVQGFTDHDRDLIVDGVLHKAAAGLTASEATAQFGLAPTGSEVAGALSDDTLTEDSLARGQYDAATITVRLVDWSDPSLFVTLVSGTLGEVKREGLAFVAEVRGLSHHLAQERGRRYLPICDADLGDARCSIDLTSSAWLKSGVVAAMRGPSTFAATGLATVEGGWLTGGRLTFATGQNAGLAVEIKEHRVIADEVFVSLWQAMPEPISAGDTFTATAGCDKRANTCAARFGNIINFRGFPGMPGDDFVTRYVIPGEPGHDGGSMR
jgi:uncharacterized phage protein (TIGR02218 family)